MKLSNLEAIFNALIQSIIRYLVAGGLPVNTPGYQRLTSYLDLGMQFNAYLQNPWDDSFFIQE